MPTEVREPLLIMFRQPDGNVRTEIWPASTDSYQGYGLLICDTVRHVARAFGVTEDQVWEWVDKERYRPTTDITKPRDN